MSYKMVVFSLAVSAINTNVAAAAASSDPAGSALHMSVDGKTAGEKRKKADSEDGAELAEAKEVEQEDAPLSLDNGSTDLSEQSMEQQAKKGVDDFMVELQARAAQDKSVVAVPSEEDPDL